MSVGWRPELWLAVIALGAYHGLNPGMGWPLAVSNGMWAKRERAVFATFLPLAGGHFLAMAARFCPSLSSSPISTGATRYEWPRAALWRRSGSTS